MTTALIKRTLPARSRIHGWGLFAAGDIDVGDIIDETPLFYVPRTPGGMLGHVYDVGDGRKAVPMGDGALCNSASRPNSVSHFDHRRGIVSLVALQTIAQGDEITIAYAQ